MTFYLIISAIQALFLRSMDEGKPLHKAKKAWFKICPKWLEKPTVECDECRSLWLSIVSMFTYSYLKGNIYFTLAVPLVMIFTYIGYRILQ